MLMDTKNLATIALFYYVLAAFSAIKSSTSSMELPKEWMSSSFYQTSNLVTVALIVRYRKGFLTRGTPLEGPFPL